MLTLFRDFDNEFDGMFGCNNNHRQMRRMMMDSYDPTYNALSAFVANNFNKNILDNDAELDIKETEEGYNVILDVPGVPKENIKISIDDSNNLVEVEASYSHTEDANTSNSPSAPKKVLKRKRYYRHAFTLPDDVEKESVDAKLEDGVLILSLKKKEMKVLENEKTYIAINN